MTTPEEKAAKFFTYPSFAVVGIDDNPVDPGNMIVNWYHEHNLPVVPIHRNTGAISIPASPALLRTAPAIGALPTPWDTALSIATKPHETKQVLDEAKMLGVPAVWLQPGSFDVPVVEWLTETDRFQVCVFGGWGLGGEGLCVLNDGHRALEAAKR